MIKPPPSSAALQTAGDAAVPARPLSTLSLACLVVANMIGVGVYTTSGYTLASLHSPAAVVVTWAVAGAIALLGAICYGGLARQVTESGGEYLFLSRGVHPAAGFMAGWISLVAGFSGAIGLSAVAFAKHLPGGLAEYETAGAIALVVIFTAVNLLGLRPAAGVQNILVFGKLAVLIVFACYGLGYLYFHYTPGEIATTTALADAADATSRAEAASPHAAGKSWTWGAVSSSLMWISLSYAGYNAAIYIAGAARNCQASVPKAMVWGTLGVTTLYVALNAVFVYAAPAAAIASQSEVALIATGFVGPSWLVESMRVVILVSLATSVLAMVQTGPHVYAQMARDRYLPKWLDTTGATPRCGILVQAVIAIALVLNSNFLDLLNYLAFLLSISSAATIGCLLLPAFRGQPGNRPVPFWPWLPLLFVVVTLWIAGHAFQFRWETDRWGLGQVLVVLPLGLAVYWLMCFVRSPRH